MSTAIGTAEIPAGLSNQELLDFFKTAVDQCPASIVVTDAQGLIVYVNRKATELTGYTFDELKGQNPRILSSGETEPEKYQELWRAIKTGKQWKGVFHNRKKNGELFWEAATIGPLLNEDGVPAHILAIKEDITRQKELEAALRCSEERFRVAAQYASDLIWELDLVTLRVQVHGSVEELLGVSFDPADGRFAHWIYNVHPDDVAIVWNMVQTSNLSRPCHPVEYRRVLADGSVRYCADRGTALIDPTGRPYKWIGVSSDITERKNSIEALSLSERRYRTIVETTAEGIWRTDQKLVTTFVNQQAADIIGLTPRELMGRSLFDFVCAEDREQIVRNRAAMRQSGKVTGEIRLIRTGSRKIWVRYVANPLFLADGTLDGYLVMFADITEQKLADDQLRLSQERFRVVAEGVADVVYEWNLETDKSQIVGGKAKGSWLNLAAHSDFLKAIHPDDLPGFVAAERKHIETGGAFSLEYRVNVPGVGTRYWEDRGVLICGGSGMPIKKLGIANDITERRSADRANADLAAIVQSIDAAAVSCDFYGRVLTWNRGAERIYGFSAEEMLGRDLLPIIPPGLEAEAIELWKSARSGHTFDHLDTTRQTKDGSLINVLTTIAPIRDDDGAIAGTAHVSWDVTQMRLLQRQLAQAQKLESIGQLAAGIAHEINTPIQYVGDNAMFLEDAFRDLISVAQGQAEPNGTDLEYLCAEVPKAIKQLQEGVTRVARIVRAMKEFSHPGKIEKVFANINAAIESTIMVSRNEWKYVADLTTDFDPDLPPVPCIVSELNQVILNLIVNAAHAIGGARSEAESTPLGKIHVATSSREGFVEIRVSDSGPGIPEAIRSKVFDPFFTTKEVGKGTGQGLAIAHAVIVQKHGGSISFESEVGRGTTFLVRLPLGESQ